MERETFSPALPTRQRDRLDQVSRRRVTKHWGSKTPLDKADRRTKARAAKRSRRTNRG